MMNGCARDVKCFAEIPVLGAFEYPNYLASSNEHRGRGLMALEPTRFRHFTYFIYSSQQLQQMDLFIPILQMRKPCSERLSNSQTAQQGNGGAIQPIMLTTIDQITVEN